MRPAPRCCLQPWRAFKPDGVIFFSDILTPLPAMGVEFDVVKGKGPIISTPLRTWDQVRACRPMCPRAPGPWARLPACTALPVRGRRSAPCDDASLRIPRLAEGRRRDGQAVRAVSMDPCRRTPCACGRQAQARGLQRIVDPSQKLPFINTILSTIRGELKGEAISALQRGAQPACSCATQHTPAPSASRHTARRAQQRGAAAGCWQQRTSRALGGLVRCSRGRRQGALMVRRRR